MREKKILKEEEEDCIGVQTAIKVFVTLCVNHTCDFWKLHNVITKLLINEIKFLSIYNVITRTPNNHKITNST